jgi:hypothetical protein
MNDNILRNLYFDHNVSYMACNNCLETIPDASPFQILYPKLDTLSGSEERGATRISQLESKEVIKWVNNHHTLFSANCMLVL